MALDRKTEVDKFDRYAAKYATAHAASLKASGEAPEFFAQHKLSCLERLGVLPEHRVLDYGCGTGSLTTLLAERFSEVHGFDPSARSLEVARARAPQATFHGDSDELSSGHFDCAVLSGVLHHVEPHLRPEVIAGAVNALKPGSGRLVVFEHNPFNPLTVRAVEACPFDDDAVLLKPRELKSLFSAAGLSPVTQQFVLFFPNLLRLFRPLEAHLSWCPLGAQTLTVGRRPEL